MPEEKDNINGVQQLSIEATTINQNFSQQVQLGRRAVAVLWARAAHAGGAERAAGRPPRAAPSAQSAAAVAKGSQRAKAPSPTRPLTRPLLFPKTQVLAKGASAPRHKFDEANPFVSPEDANEDLASVAYRCASPHPCAPP